MKLPIMNMSGVQVGEADLTPEIFEADVNVPLMHQAYVRQMANMRRGTHSTRTRSQIRVSKSKIYRQKGTGRARHGSRNAPIFVGGGQAHGPKPRSYRQDMPRKMRRQALRSALSAVVRDEQLVLLEGWSIEAPKTKLVAQVLDAVAGTRNALVVLMPEERDSAVYVAARNLPNVTVLDVRYLNIRDLLKHEKVVLPVAALDMIADIWGNKEVANG